MKTHRCVCEADTPKPRSSDQAINFSNEFLLAASADVDHRLFYLRVFSMGLFFKLYNLLLAAVCHDISEKSSHLKTCSLVPVCHQLYAVQSAVQGIVVLHILAIQALLVWRLILTVLTLSPLLLILIVSETLRPRLHISDWT